MADGERGQECCKIKLSDLKLFSQGQALSHPMPWGREDRAPGTNWSWRGGVGNRNGNRGWRAGGALRRGMRSGARSRRPADLPCRSLSHGPWIPRHIKSPQGPRKRLWMQRSPWNARPVPALSYIQMQIHLWEAAHPRPENVGKQPRNSSCGPTSTRPQAVTSRGAPSQLKPTPGLPKLFRATCPNYPWGLGPSADCRRGGDGRGPR